MLKGSSLCPHRHTRCSAYVPSPYDTYGSAPTRWVRRPHPLKHAGHVRESHYLLLYYLFFLLILFLKESNECASVKTGVQRQKTAQTFPLPPPPSPSPTPPLLPTPTRICAPIVVGHRTPENCLMQVCEGVRGGMGKGLHSRGRGHTGAPSLTRRATRYPLHTHAGGRNVRVMGEIRGVGWWVVLCSFFLLRWGTGSRRIRGGGVVTKRVGVGCCMDAHGRGPWGWEGGGVRTGGVDMAG